MLISRKSRTNLNPAVLRFILKQWILDELKEIGKYLVKPHFFTKNSYKFVNLLNYDPYGDRFKWTLYLYK